VIALGLPIWAILWAYRRWRPRPALVAPAAPAPLPAPQPERPVAHPGKTD
jgi:hypothetical protein